MPLLSPDIVALIASTAESHRIAVRHDSAGAMLERDLEHVKNEVIEERRAPLVGFTRFPIDTSVPSGAKSFVAKHRSRTGRAKRIAGSGSDLPSVSVETGRETFPICDYGLMAEYSSIDMARAAFAGESLDAEQMRAARQAAEETMHDVLWNGDAKGGLWGVFAHPLIPRVPMSTAIGSGSSADDIIDAINALVTGIVERTNGAALGPFRIEMPIAQYNYLSTTARSATSDRTILEFLERANPAIESIAAAWPCKGAGSGGADCVVVHAASNARFVISKEFDALPAQREGLAIKIPMYACAGGLYVPYPLEMAIGELPT